MVAPNTLYHIFNRGNNQRPIFFQERNFQFFKQKTLRELSDHVSFIAYCLMPNHFHFLAYTKSDINEDNFSNGLRTLLSSYTRAIQRQEKFTGSLFQQNSKKKDVVSNDYALTCFHYIHQNPLKAGLVKKIEDWPHCSFNEYWLDSPGLCDTTLGRQIITMSPDFYKESYKVVSENRVKRLIE
jgi:putative transposase